MLNGSNSFQENEPKHIQEIISKFALEVEIDLWRVSDKLYLGHDAPTHEITTDFLMKNENSLWVHCKNTEALQYCNSLMYKNYFWHENDTYTLTSDQVIWNHFKNVAPFPKGSVILLFSMEDILDNLCLFENGNPKNYAICTDFPLEFKKMIDSCYGKVT